MTARCSSRSSSSSRERKRCSNAFCCAFVQTNFGCRCRQRGTPHFDDFAPLGLVGKMPTMTRVEALSVLEISEGATDAEIKTAWKKAALKHHPDKNGATSSMKARSGTWYQSAPSRVESCRRK